MDSLYGTENIVWWPTVRWEGYGQASMSLEVYMPQKDIYSFETQIFYKQKA